MLFPDVAKWFSQSQIPTHRPPSTPWSFRRLAQGQAEPATCKPRFLLPPSPNPKLPHYPCSDKFVPVHIRNIAPSIFFRSLQASGLWSVSGSIWRLRIRRRTMGFLSPKYGESCTAPAHRVIRASTRDMHAYLTLLFPLQTQGLLEIWQP